LSAASLQHPGSFEERRDSRQRRDKRHRGPFLWFVSLGKQRNEQTDIMCISLISEDNRNWGAPLTFFVLVGSLALEDFTA
jgi:hypothetical protein